MRSTFDLDSLPVAAPARWFAFSRCAVYVNGVEIGRGPVRSNPRRQTPDERDIGSHLRVGTNTLAVMACLYPTATAWWMPPPPEANDLARGAFVFEAIVGDDTWVTNDSWEATILDGWTASSGVGVSGRGREILDARSLPADWMSATGWPAAVERRAFTIGEPGRPEPPSYPGGPLGHRPLPWPTPDDVTLEHVGDDTWVADRIVAGSLTVDFEGPVGAEMLVRVAEFLDADGVPAPGEHDASAALVCDGTRRTLETFDSYGLNGILTTMPDGVTIHSISVRERFHPVTGGATFSCSDHRLDTIWAVGRRTVTLNSFDAYTDCPTREQRAWTGDAVVHQMVDLTTNADWTLARWHPTLAASPRADGMLAMAVAGDVEAGDVTIIPDWALHWVRSVWNLYRYVGDREEIGRLLPVVEGVLRWFEPFCDDAGMPTDVFGWVIIDWSSVYTEGVSASLCGLWGRALTNFAEMASWLGDEGRADWARTTHARLAAGFERLWDPDRRLYVDHEVGGIRRPSASQHAQASAIVGELAPPDRMDRLVEVITDTTRHVHATFSVTDGPAPPNCEAPVGGGDFLFKGHPPEPWWDVDDQVVVAQPFFRYVVHDALARAGRSDLIAAQCLDWVQALERSPTSWTETWFGGTKSHGWSSTPTRDLMTRVLGVEPAEPGFAVARIDPHLGGLAWARGAVPCPLGLIEIEIDAEEIRVTSPIELDHRGARHPAGNHTFPLDNRKP